MTFGRILIASICFVVCVMIAVAFIWELQSPDTSLLRILGGWIVIGIGLNLYVSIADGS